jgi:two-component system, response regulator YcbB
VKEDEMMLFYLTDDDAAIRTMLAEIIEDEDLGVVAGEAEDGSLLDGQILNMRNIDILIIDLLMPIQDGIETIRQIKPAFQGKIIMLSQVESKELIGEAYSLGIEYFITKPINRIEVVSVIQKVIGLIRLEKSIHDIHKSLNTVLKLEPVHEQHLQLPDEKNNLRSAAHFLLSELGIVGESGSKDLLDMVDYLYQYEHDQAYTKGIPTLKTVFLEVAKKRLGKSAAERDLSKEIKASEQRVRRAINQSLSNLASLGLTDFSNLKFETYSSKFFDFTDVRNRMAELENSNPSTASLAHINTKKFIQILYFEAKRIHSGSRY